MRNNMEKSAEVSKFSKFMKWVKNLLFLTIGAIITAFALESFLVPNNIIDCEPYHKIEFRVANSNY